MTKTAWRMAGLTVMGLAAGCADTGRRQPYADNPLLLSREPLPPTSPAASVKSAPPRDAQAAVRSWAPRGGPPARPAGPVPGGDAPVLTTAAATLPAQTPPPPPPAEPTFNPAPAPAHLPVPPAPIRQASAQEAAPPAVARARLDHAPDYAWLQGEFDVHYRGHRELRYKRPSEEDTYGGKVRLVDDPRLADFRPGDLIHVEGELVRDDSAAGQPPRYHVRNVRLIERRATKN